MDRFMRIGPEIVSKYPSSRKQLRRAIYRQSQFVLNLGIDH